MRKPKRIYEPLTKEQFLSLLKHTKKEHHKICFILGYGSGLRISEVNKIKPEDIRLNENKIMIRQAKGSKDRMVNSPKWLRERHMSHFPIKIGERAISKVFLAKSLLAGFNSVLFTDQKGIKRYKYHFHSLRHSYATRLLDRGVPVHQVQILLGHENLATTSKYTKANPTDAIQSVLDKDF